MSDLIERCREILEWKRTGVLPGNKLRAMASDIYGDEYDAVRRAEELTKETALKFVADNYEEFFRLRSSLSVARSEGIREGLEMAEKAVNNVEITVPLLVGTACGASAAQTQIAAAIRAKIEEVNG